MSEKYKGKVSVLINSAFRDKTVFPNPNRFTINLPRHLRNVTGVLVKNLFMYANEAEYVIIVVKQFTGSKLTSPVESTWRIPSNAINVTEALAREQVGRDVKYLSNSTMRVCFDTPIGVLKQMDIEVYGRYSVGHIVLAAPTPLVLFPFTVPGHEWSGIFEFECDPGFT